MKWDGYIHKNGELIIQKLFNGESFIDRSSPFVVRYLPPVEAKNAEEAKILLSQK
jgi:hypothetical protein